MLLRSIILILFGGSISQQSNWDMQGKNEKSVKHVFFQTQSKLRVF